MNTSTEQQTQYDIKEILKKIVEELDQKIETVTNRKNNEITKAEFFRRESNNETKDFPVSKDTYNIYSTFAKNKKSNKHIKTISLQCFYDICRYTDVSADYLLGFNTSKRKEESAEKVRQEFGLSDKSMETLSLIKKNKPEVKGELSSDIVNIILENQTFWRKLNDRLPIYLSDINYSRADIDVDVARYTLNRVFEELIDDICDKLQSDKLPYEELDNTGVFGQ